MPIDLPMINLSAAVVGTKATITFGQAVPPPTLAQQMNPRTLGPMTMKVYNESGCGLACVWPENNQSFTIPAGQWPTLYPPPNETQLNLTVVYILPNAPVNQLHADLYLPGETVYDTGALGNSPVNGGAAVSSANANFLQGVGQTKALTEIDDLNPIGTGSLALYDQNAILIPTGATALHAQALELASRRLDGATEVGIAIAAGFVKIFNTVYSYNGILTAGLGQPIIVQRNFATAQTLTAIQNIIVFTVGATDAHYRINHWLDLNNGVTPNNVTWQVVYTDAATSAGVTINMPLYQGATAIQIADGATARANGRYSGLDFSIWAKAATSVTVLFRDPTNTPSDSYSVIVEQLN